MTLITTIHFLFAILTLNLFANTLVGDKPFKPALASEQAQITSRSMDAEGLQFEQMGLWNIEAGNVKNAETLLEQRKEELATTEKLFKTGGVTQAALDFVKFSLENAESQLAVATAKQNLHLAQGIKYKFVVLEEGNPGSDYRLKIAKATKDMHTNKKILFEADLHGSESSLPFYHKFLKDTEKLFALEFGTASNLRNSKTALRTAEEKVRSLKIQIQLENAAIAASQATIDALP